MNEEVVVGKLVLQQYIINLCVHHLLVPRTLTHLRLQNTVWLPKLCKSLLCRAAQTNQQTLLLPLLTNAMPGQLVRM